MTNTEQPTRILVDPQGPPLLLSDRFRPIPIAGAHGRFGDLQVVILDDVLDESGYVTVDTPKGKASGHVLNIHDIVMPMEPGFTPTFDTAVGLIGYITHDNHAARVKVVDVAENIQHVVVCTASNEYLVVELSDIREWEKPLDIERYVRPMVASQ